MNTFLYDWLQAILAGSQVALISALVIVLLGTYVALMLTRK